MRLIKRIYVRTYAGMHINWLSGSIDGTLSKMIDSEHGPYLRKYGQFSVDIRLFVIGPWGT
jgi:hypothetical protein